MSDLKLLEGQREQQRAESGYIVFYVDGTYIFRDVIDRMIECRSEIVGKVFQYRNKNCIRLPVNFKYLIQSVHGQLQIDETFAVDITPLEAMELIEDNWTRMMGYSRYTQVI